MTTSIPKIPANSNSSFLKKHSDQIRIVADLATIGVFIAAICSVYDTRSSIEQSNQRADSSIAVAYQTMYSTLRPYMVVSRIEPKDFRSKGIDTIRLFYKNTGQTPAYNLDTKKLGIVKFTEPTKSEIDEIRREETGNLNAGFIGPGMEYEVPIVGVKYSEIEAHIERHHRNKDISIFLYGKIAYRDNFKVKHEQIYCYRWYIEEKRWMPHKFNEEYDVPE